MVQSSALGPAHGVLILEGAVDDGITYSVRRGDGTTTGDDEIEALTPEDESFTADVQTLVSRPTTGSRRTRRPGDRVRVLRGTGRRADRVHARCDGRARPGQHGGPRRPGLAGREGARPERPLRSGLLGARTLLLSCRGWRGRRRAGAGPPRRRVDVSTADRRSSRARGTPWLPAGRHGGPRRRPAAGHPRWAGRGRPSTRTSPTDAPDRATAGPGRPRLSRRSGEQCGGPRGAPPRRRRGHGGAAPSAAADEETEPEPLSVEPGAVTRVETHPDAVLVTARDGLAPGLLASRTGGRAAGHHPVPGSATGDLVRGARRARRPRVVLELVNPDAGAAVVDVDVHAHPWPARRARPARHAGAGAQRAGGRPRRHRAAPRRPRGAGGRCPVVERR